MKPEVVAVTEVPASMLWDSQNVGPEIIGASNPPRRVLRFLL